MSDGMTDSRREAEKTTRVEVAALELAEALLATGDPMFFTIHPAAADIVNEVLEGEGVPYRLGKVRK